MLRELTIACEEALGVKLTDDQRVRVAQRVAQHFGGERVYVPKRAWFVVDGRFDLSGGVRNVMGRYSIGRSKAYELMRRRK